MTSENSASLNQREAEQIGRLFVMLFNSAILYGCCHPSTKKNAGVFFDALSGSLKDHAIVSFMINQGALMVEDWPLDKTVNIGKLIQHFDKIGIRSVSFEQNVSRKSIEDFLSLAGDTTKIASAKEKIADSAKGALPKVRINYILFGKMTADQVSAGRSGTPQQQAPPQTTSQSQNSSEIMLSAEGLSKEALTQIEQVLTLTSLLEKPGKAAAVLSKAQEDAQCASTVSRTFGKLKAEISEAQPHTVEELLEALLELKTDLAEAIEVQKTTGSMIKSSELLSNQMNELTCDAIVKLVKEEYGAGKLSLKRLTQIIRRMLPDNSELMSVLPRLKEMLLSEGMSLSDYLQLIRMLDMEIRSEALSGSLHEAADSIGASVNDLVEAIKTKPEEAAQLVLLASEIRQGTEKDTSGLADILTDHIEEVCSRMALENPQISGPQGGQALKKVLAKLESQLFAQLKKKGVEEPVLLRVKKQLTKRFETTFSSVSDKWIGDLVDSNGEEDIEALSRSLRNFAGTTIQQSKLQNSLTAALKSRGYDAEQIEKFFSQLTKQIASGGKIILPSGALGSNNMLFLINREIKQHIRYKTPFSSIMVSLVSVTQDEECRPPTKEEHAAILPQLFTCVKTLLRDIDLIGTVDQSDTPSVFAILSMTDGEGAQIVRNRLKKNIENSDFFINETKVDVGAAVSVTVPEEETKDLKSYLALTRKNHDSELES
ncbi:MAG: hypothetical protein ACOCW1_00895 [Chitinispirillaceae bacterium]